MSPESDDGPLTAEQRQEFADAGRRASGLAFAGKIATLNGWSIGGFAAITLVFGLFSLTALILGVGMAVVARNEFRGRALLRSFDPAGPRLLGLNQLGFMALIVLYCCWSIYQALYGSGLQLGQFAQLEQILGDAEDLVTTLTLTLYGGVIVATVLFQGLNARYYWTRGRIIEEYLRDTPAWVVELHRSASPGSK